MVLYLNRQCINSSAKMNNNWMKKVALGTYTLCFLIALCRIVVARQRWLPFDSAPLSSNEQKQQLLENMSFSPPVNDTFYEKMVELGGVRSMNHYAKFKSRRNRIPDVFVAEDRYSPIVRRYAAIVLSETWAFLHVWKCGGTTVEALTAERQRSLLDQEIQRRNWLALVRDPIDRFLSAWAECGERLYEREINFHGEEKWSSLNWLEGEYDFRIRAFLREVKDYLPPSRTCHSHAFPQGNFMLNRSGEIDEHLRFVGDLNEIRQSLRLAGLRMGTNDFVSRDASESLVKKHYFQSRRDLLSDETILELCKFLAIDYFLFDFDPPDVCVQDGGPLAPLRFR